MQTDEPRGRDKNKIPAADGQRTPRVVMPIFTTANLQRDRWLSGSSGREKTNITSAGGKRTPRVMMPVFTAADLPRHRVQGHEPQNNFFRQLDPTQFNGHNWRCISAHQTNGGQYKSLQILVLHYI